jgi:threonine dehydrogenase-like Zn-dependent dehydrogenase
MDDIPEPGLPRAGRVVVRPETVGIRGSDLHLFSGHTGALSDVRDFLPRIQGHEISAVIDELGPAAPPHLEPGPRVTVMPATRCGHCYPGRSGRSNVRVQDVKANAALGGAAVLAATAAGLEVMVADPEAHRRQIARGIGADEALTAVAEVVSRAVQIQITVSGGGAET